MHPRLLPLCFNWPIKIKMVCASVDLNGFQGSVFIGNLRFFEAGYFLKVFCQFAYQHLFTSTNILRGINFKLCLPGKSRLIFN